MVCDTFDCLSLCLGSPGQLLTSCILTGDVIHLQVFGKSIILLNSAEATNDLLEGRFGIYSDRPAFPLIDL